MHNQLRGGRYLAEERGAFERQAESPRVTDQLQLPRREFHVPMIDFLDRRSQSFFAWVAEHGWSELRHA